MKRGWLPAIGIAMVVAGSVSRLPAIQKDAAHAATAEVEDLVRQALDDRFKAGDIPDLDLLEERAHVLVLKEMPRPRLQLSARALPKIAGTEFELIGANEASARAERSRKDVVFLTVNDPRIEGAAAFVWLGVDLAMPSKAGVVKMCCCTGRAEFRKADGRWVFVKWGGMTCS